MTRLIRLDQKFFDRLHVAHLGVRRDNDRAVAITPEKRCRRCGGTGNQLLAMYQQCCACGGDGITRGNEEAIAKEAP